MLEGRIPDSLKKESLHAYYQYKAKNVLKVQNFYGVLKSVGNDGKKENRKVELLFVNFGEVHTEQFNHLPKNLVSLELSNTVILPHAQRDLLRSSSFNFLRFPKLKRMNFCEFSDPDEAGKIFKDRTKIKSLKKVKFDYWNSKNTLEKRLTFLSSFPNLKSLSFSFYDFDSPNYSLLNEHNKYPPLIPALAKNCLSKISHLTHLECTVTPLIESLLIANKHSLQSLKLSYGDPWFGAKSPLNSWKSLVCEGLMKLERLTFFGIHELDFNSNFFEFLQEGELHWRKNISLKIDHYKRKDSYKEDFENLVKILNSKLHSQDFKVNWLTFDSSITLENYHYPY